MAELRKLIFYSTIGPDRDNAAFQPFTMARRALDAGLEVEMYLAGPATGLLRRHVRERQEGRPKESFEAVVAAKVPFYFSQGCANYRGVESTDLDEVGAKPAEMADILRDVAMGAQLIPFVG